MSKRRNRTTFVRTEAAQPPVMVQRPEVETPKAADVIELVDADERLVVHPLAIEIGSSPS